MNITWFNDAAKNIVATLTSSSITLNKYGALYFESAYKVMLGYNSDEKVIFIRPLNKQEVIRGDIKEHTMYNISLNVSYARITNKLFLERVDNLFSLDLSDEGRKYKAIWKKNLNALEISLEEAL